MLFYITRNINHTHTSHVGLKSSNRHQGSYHDGSGIRIINNYLSYVCTHTHIHLVQCSLTLAWTEGTGSGQLRISSRAD